MQVNIFGYENKVYPLYISKKSFDQTLNLLLIFLQRHVASIINFFRMSIHSFSLVGVFNRT